MNPTTPADTEVKTRHRAMWASGDYPSMVESFLLPLGPRLVEASGIGPGMDVLDVAAGTGNASLPAAERGAKVTASDLTPELLEAGRRRAKDAGLELDWVEADAERLPFEDESFDAVISAIGAMFTPNHQATADELVRVCRPGGTIALLSWTPEGVIGGLFRTLKPFAPRPLPAPSPRRSGAARSTSASCSATGSSWGRSSATCSRSPSSRAPATSRPTSGSATGLRSRPRTTRAARAGTVSSRRR